MNQAICLGFPIWYSFMPSLMLTIGNYDWHWILSPDFDKSFKDSTREWSPQTIKLAEELCEDLSHSLMHAAGSTLETGGPSTSGCGTSAESNETGTFDPLGIRAREETHKVVLRKLVISCLAVCLLSTVSYITVGGTELCLQFLEGRFQEERVIMSSKMKNDMFLTGLKARSRYLSSYKDEIHPFCSLHRLAYAIGMTYNELPDVFVELTEQKVRSIQKSVKDGTYTLSPLLLRHKGRPKAWVLPHLSSQGWVKSLFGHQSYTRRQPCANGARAYVKPSFSQGQPFHW